MVNAPTVGTIIEIIVVIIGLFLSAFFSGSELSLFSLRKSDFESIANDGARKRVQSLLAEPERLLATILVGNDLVNCMIAIVSSVAIAQVFHFQSSLLEFLMATVLVTFLIVLFGEVIPKLYATNYAVKFATFASAPLTVVSKLFAPITALLTKSTWWIRRVVNTRNEALSVDDLSHALEASKVENKDDKELLEGILSFGDKTVSDIMRPRVDVEGIDMDSTFNEAVARVVETGYSRLPAYEDGSLDKVKGILYAKDLLPYIGKHDEDFSWQSLLRPAYFVPETRMIDDLLEDFRGKKMHMAIVVDEFGGTQGIATLEDVLEEIVGDIDDEYDTEEKFYTKVDDHTYIFEGKTLLSDFARVLDIEESELGDHAEDAETVAGLLLDIKRDFLREGETVTCGKFTFTVLKVLRHRIDKVKVQF